MRGNLVAKQKNCTRTMEESAEDAELRPILLVKAIVVWLEKFVVAIPIFFTK